VDGIRVTPLELAAAYRWLAIQLAAHESSAARRWFKPVWPTLPALNCIFSVAGGSPLQAKPALQPWSWNSLHGWFAGLAPADRPRVVVVVYLPPATEPMPHRLPRTCFLTLPQAASAMIGFVRAIGFLVVLLSAFAFGQSPRRILWHGAGRPLDALHDKRLLFLQRRMGRYAAHMRRRE